MAVVRKLKPLQLERDSMHTEVEGTYSIIRTADGVFLQIDTYGSPTRQERGKKSQSIRFSPDAISQLKVILSSEV